MKKLFILIFISTLLLSACSSVATSIPASSESYTSLNLPVDYEGALPIRNQLAIGLLKWLTPTRLLPPHKPRSDHSLAGFAPHAGQHHSSSGRDQRSARANRKPANP